MRGRSRPPWKPGSTSSAPSRAASTTGMPTRTPGLGTGSATRKSTRAKKGSPICANGLRTAAPATASSGAARFSASASFFSNVETLLAAAAEMPGPGPGREQQENLRSVVASHRVALVRLEVGERARGSLDLAIGARDPHGALDDEEPGVLLDLMVAEFLPRIEADEDSPRLVLTLQDYRRAGARGSRDLGEPPALHRAPV